MADLNTFAAVSALAQDIQDDAVFVVREASLMQRLVNVFSDMTGGNPRVGYAYNQASAGDIGEADDLTSSAFTPSADQTLTPSEIGLQFFVTDKRVSSELPENWRNDASQELGFAALDKIETDLIGEMANLTGGTVGASGTVITWGYVAAAIAVARNANKNAAKPLSCVLHGYQWAVLAKSASIAGATSMAQSSDLSNQATQASGVQVASFMGVPIYQVFAAADSSTDFTGGVFPREAIAIDWRQAIRVEAERDASRRGTELNMSGLYAHGVWRPARGVKMIFNAAAPTS
jgi:hypothetical protein